MPGALVMQAPGAGSPRLSPLLPRSLDHAANTRLCQGTSYWLGAQIRPGKVPARCASLLFIVEQIRVHTSLFLLSDAMKEPKQRARGCVRDLSGRGSSCALSEHPEPGFHQFAVQLSVSFAHLIHKQTRPSSSRPLQRSRMWASLDK